jgi:hypothetical protein
MGLNLVPQRIPARVPDHDAVEVVKIFSHHNVENVDKLFRSVFKSTL